jgi:hypothetical protein
MDSPGPNGKDQGQRPVPANGHEEAPGVFLPEYKFPTPEAKHQHQRARAEERFGIDLGTWETANRENPPRSMGLSVSAASEVRTERRNNLDTVLSLENHTKQFLFAALCAYGDVLLDKRAALATAVCGGSVIAVVGGFISLLWVVRLEREVHQIRSQPHWALVGSRVSAPS